MRISVQFTVSLCLADKSSEDSDFLVRPSSENSSTQLSTTKTNGCLRPANSKQTSNTRRRFQ